MAGKRSVAVIKQSCARKKMLPTAICKSATGGSILVLSLKLHLKKWLDKIKNDPGGVQVALSGKARLPGKNFFDRQFHQTFYTFVPLIYFRANPFTQWLTISWSCKANIQFSAGRHRSGGGQSLLQRVWSESTDCEVRYANEAYLPA